MIAPPRQDIPELTQVELVLATDHLTLRPLVETDVDALWPTVSDPEFPRLMMWNAHTERAQTVAFVRAQAAAFAKGTDCLWAMIAGDQLVGLIGLHDITWQFRAGRRDRAEIGYWVAPPHQKLGHATDAVFAVQKFGFETLGLHKLMIGCLGDNAASKRVIEKSGFRFIAKIDEDLWRDGRWHSQLRYELTFNEWSDVSTTLRFNRPRRP